MARVRDVLVRETRLSEDVIRRLAHIFGCLQSQFVQPFSLLGRYPEGLNDPGDRYFP